MARDFVINGECLVTVKGMPTTPIATLQQLGLSDRQGVVTISPRYYHKDVKVDDFGPDVPPEVMAMIQDVLIRMTLVHYDADILDACLMESLGGLSPTFPGGGIPTSGLLAGAGILLGNGQPRLAKGNHYIGLNLASPVLKKPWRFLTTYLAEQPVEIPLSTKRSTAKLSWRAIPYTMPTAYTFPVDASSQDPSKNSVGSGGEVLSANALVWDRSPDT